MVIVDMLDSSESDVLAALHDSRINGALQSLSVRVARDGEKGISTALAMVVECLCWETGHCSNNGQRTIG